MDNILYPVKANRRAFALIELLTVIAIIGILAAIIIPTVGRVRESARAMQCVSNLRQINMAVRLYAENNKGFLPASARDELPTETGTGTTVNWAKELGRYLPQRGTSATAGEHPVFVCGAAEFNGKRGDELNSTYTVTAAIIPPGGSKVRRALGTFPSCTWSVFTADASAASHAQTTSFDFRHNGRMNVTYMDGSVRAMDFASFKTLDQRVYGGLAAL
jgi:prepilin-type N-terminal cleavage/methylation domain-containing protein/prepilin-type processing-associated H-X9-DG protein